MALNIYFLIILVTFGEETAKHFTKNPLGNNLIINYFCGHKLQIIVFIIPGDID